jgi:hypothetical protein
MAAARAGGDNNTPIHDGGDDLNLTDMFHASGSPVGKDPAQWLKLRVTREFVDHICSLHNTTIHHIIRAVRGKGGCTWAHWQIGLAYAKHLSPAFHQWCNKVVRRVMEGRAAPTPELPAGRLSEEQARPGVHRLHGADSRCACGAHRENGARRQRRRI